MLDAPTTNRELVEEAHDLGNAASWQKLYQRYHTPIVQHCLRSGLSEIEAQEIFQETMAKVAQRLEKRSFNWDSTTFRGWLNQATNQLIFEAHRQNRHKDLPAESLAQVREWLGAAMAPELESIAREKMEAHLWSVCLARARNGVKARHWQIFEAYALEGQSSAAVASLFNSTQVQVRIIRYRVLGRLRTEWQNLQNGPIELDDE